MRGEVFRDNYSVVDNFAAQRRIRRAREETNKLVVMDLKVDNQDNGLEYQFWEGKYIPSTSYLHS